MRMALPESITATELANRLTPTSLAVWAAFRRGEIRLLWEDQCVGSMSIDKRSRQLYLKLDELITVATPINAVLDVRPIRKPGLVRTLTAGELYDVTNDAVLALWHRRQCGEVRFAYSGRVFEDLTSNPNGPGKVIHYNKRFWKIVADDALIEVFAVTR